MTKIQYSATTNTETGETEVRRGGSGSTLGNNLVPEGADAAGMAQEAATARSFGRGKASYTPAGYDQFGQGGFKDVSSDHADASDVADLHFNGSIASTAKTSYGAPKGGSNLSPSDVVELPGGLETTVAVAEQMGYLRKAADGSYIDAPNAFDAPTTEQQPDYAANDFDTPEEDRAGQLPDQEAEAFTEKLVSALPQEHLSAGVKEAVETGELSDRTLTYISEGLGISTDQAAAEVNRVASAMSRSYDKAISDEGLATPEMKADFMRWVEQTDPARAKAARQSMITKANPTGYAKLASEFVSTMDSRDPEGVVEMAKASGIEARHDARHGEVYLSIPGHGEVSWKMAVREGYVSAPYKPR